MSYSEINHEKKWRSYQSGLLFVYTCHSFFSYPWANLELIFYCIFQIKSYSILNNVLEYHFGKFFWLLWLPLVNKGSYRRKIKNKKNFINRTFFVNFVNFIDVLLFFFWVVKVHINNPSFHHPQPYWKVFDIPNPIHSGKNTWLW